VRILNLVAGEKWTGAAAVVFDQTAAMIAAGMEAQFAFVSGSLLAERLLPLGWARPLITHPRTPVNVLRDSWRLRDTVRRERFDVLHAHTTHDHAVAIFAARRTDARVVRTLHNIRYVSSDPLSRVLFRRTQAFAFANREIAEKFAAPGVVLPPVVDAERFRPGSGGTETRRRFGLPGGIVAGTVGKMAAGRGHEEAIRAAAALTSVSVAHVGHGEHMPHLKKMADDEGASGRNFWLGYQEEALPEFYRSWDVFLFPASGSEQGQRAILEAMASGLPVVAREAPGVRDLMTDGEEGFVASDAGGMTAALSRLAESPDLRREMGTKARQRSLAFTAPTFAKTAKAFYDTVFVQVPANPAIHAPSVP
jgi:glycosyltransferase involved in cell wall biosynthesis